MRPGKSTIYTIYQRFVKILQEEGAEGPFPTKEHIRNWVEWRIHTLHNRYTRSPHFHLQCEAVRRIANISRVESNKR